MREKVRDLLSIINLFNGLDDSALTPLLPLAGRSDGRQPGQAGRRSDRSTDRFGHYRRKGAARPENV